jgi:hypothetical protein
MNTGKINDEVLAALKLANPDTKLYRFSLNAATDIIFKAITRNVYREVFEQRQKFENKNQNVDVFGIHKQIIKSCVVWPEFSEEDLEQNLAIGAVPSIVKRIEKISGFTLIDIFDRIEEPFTDIVQVHRGAKIPRATNEEIQQLKDHPDIGKFPLFNIEIEDYNFILRPGTRADFKAVTDSIDPDTKFIKLLCMWPSNIDIDMLPAGVAAILSQKALEISGWAEDGDVTEV